MNPQSTARAAFAVLAGGCFWGVEELLRAVPGVLATEVGYAGGDGERATYKHVKTGTTGHAEAIRIDFDPAVLTFESLLHLFFKMHNPTTLNAQGNDRGSQYRSAIFYIDETQKQTALRVIREVEQSKFWPNPLVTEVVPFDRFYPAEDYHQDYLQKNPGGYTCHYWRESGAQ